MRADHRHGARLFVTHPRVRVWGQLCALTFVLLIVLPFTAPFQTIDLTQHRPTTGSVISSDKKTTKDLTVSPTRARSTATVMPVADAISIRRDSSLTRPTCTPILRL